MCNCGGTALGWCDTLTRADSWSWTEEIWRQSWNRSYLTAYRRIGPPPWKCKQWWRLADHSNVQVWTSCCSAILAWATNVSAVQQGFHGLTCARYQSCLAWKWWGKLLHCNTSRCYKIRLQFLLENIPENSLEGSPACLLSWAWKWVDLGIYEHVGIYSTLAVMEQHLDHHPYHGATVTSHLFAWNDERFSCIDMFSIRSHLHYCLLQMNMEHLQVFQGHFLPLIINAKIVHNTMRHFVAFSFKAAIPLSSYPISLLSFQWTWFSCQPFPPEI